MLPCMSTLSTLINVFFYYVWKLVSSVEFCVSDQWLLDYNESACKTNDVFFLFFLLLLFLVLVIVTNVSKYVMMHM